MSSDSKPVVAHIESTAGIQPEQVGAIQQEIDKIVLLTEEEFKVEEKKLLRKVSDLAESRLISAPFADSISSTCLVSPSRLSAHDNQLLLMTPYHS